MLSQEETFTLGETEKHNINFKIDPWWGGFFVTVDGAKTFINGQSIVGGQFTIEVGDQEKHTVTFQITLRPFFPAFRRKYVQVLVDGKIFKNYS